MRLALPLAAIATIGLGRSLDIYSGMHNPGGRGAIASGFLSLAVSLQNGDMAMPVRVLAGFVVTLAAPVSAHLLAFLMARAGYSMANQSVCNETAAVNNE